MDIRKKTSPIVFLAICSFTMFSCVTSPNINEENESFLKSIPANWQVTVNEAVVDKENIISDLNSLISDDKIQLLIQEALRANPDLKATAYRLDAARYLTETEFAKQLPSLDANGGWEKFGDGDQGSSRVTIRSSVKWEIDIWQKLSNEYDAMNFEVRVQYNDYIAARNLLATKVLRDWIRIIAAKKAITIEKRRIVTLNNIENIILERYERGLGEVKDIDTTRVDTERARASLASRNLDLLKAQKELEILLGRYPSGSIDASITFPAINRPVVAIPSELLQQREDIKSAWNTLQQSHYAFSAANKAYLPEITLTGDVSNIANDIGDLLTGKILWNIGLGIAQPVFDGGEKLNLARSKAEEIKAGWEKYRATVLNAMLEVEESLATDKWVSHKIRHVNKSLAYARESRIFYEEQYSKGLTNITDVLYARGIEYDTEIAQLENQLLQIDNRIQLALAAGFNILTVH